MVPIQYHGITINNFCVIVHRILSKLAGLKVFVIYRGFTACVCGYFEILSGLYIYQAAIFICLDV